MGSVDSNTKATIALLEVQVQEVQCPPPPLDTSITVKGLKSGNFNSNSYYFDMGLKTLAIGLYEVWAHMVCFAKLSPQSFKSSKFLTLRKVNDRVNILHIR